VRFLTNWARGTRCQAPTTTRDIDLMRVGMLAGEGWNFLLLLTNPS
jgi:hypothetical protein